MKNTRKTLLGFSQGLGLMVVAMIDMAVVAKRLNRDEELAVLNMGKQLGYNQKAVEEKIAERMPSK